MTDPIENSIRRHREKLARKKAMPARAAVPRGCGMGWPEAKDRDDYVPSPVHVVSVKTRHLSVREYVVELVAKEVGVDEALVTDHLDVRFYSAAYAIACKLEQATCLDHGRIHGDMWEGTDGNFTVGHFIALTEAALKEDGRAGELVIVKDSVCRSAVWSIIDGEGRYMLLG